MRIICVPLWIVGFVVLGVSPASLKVAGLHGLTISGAAGAVLILMNALIPSLCLPV